MRTAAITLLFLWSTSMPQTPLMPARDAVDHLLLGVADVEQGIAAVERLTGVRAVAGGVHPGRGTRNALLSLGGRQYLEIIGPDPAQAASSPRPDLLALKEPTLIGWAAAATDLDGLAQRARSHGQALAAPRDGSRARPDGKTLRWRSLSAPASLALNGVDPIPFFIQWSADSLHPSQDSPGGMTLQSLEIEHPNASAVTETLRRLGIDATVRQATNARLIAVLSTPKGTVTLSGPVAPAGEAAAQRATGSFDVKITPQAADEGKPEGPPLGRMTLDKQYHGDLQGLATGEMLTAGDLSVRNSGGYVAVERVSGTLKGRKGSFALQHSGTMNRGAQQLSITIVPDSGTGALEGIAGRMNIRIEGKAHYYDLEYTLTR